MAKRMSFSKHEQQIRPEFRQNLNHAESVEDVKKFYSYSIRKLFDRAFSQGIAMEYDDVVLDPSMEKGFCVSDHLLGNATFSNVWLNSDLPNITERLTETALNRYKRLAKNPAKTEKKICAPPGH